MTIPDEKGESLIWGWEPDFGRAWPTERAAEPGMEHAAHHIAQCRPGTKRWEWQ